MKIEPLRVQDARFNARETAILYALAGATLKEQGMSKKEARKYIETLTPANVLRLALGSEFPIRHRGGSRPNKGKRIYCIACKRAGKKSPIYLDDLCRECWHEQADAKSAMI